MKTSRRIKMGILAILTFVHSVVGISPAQPAHASPATITVTGTATQSNGNPIEGVTVSFVDSTTSLAVAAASTVPDGTYSVDVPAGTYDISFEKGGEFQLVTLTNRVLLENTVISINLAPVPPQAHVVSGVVRDESGALLSGVVVSVGNGLTGVSAVSAADGSYSLSLACQQQCSVVTYTESGGTFVFGSKTLTTNVDEVVNLWIPSVSAQTIRVIDQDGAPIQGVAIGRNINPLSAFFAGGTAVSGGETESVGVTQPVQTTDVNGEVAVKWPSLASAASFDLRAEPPASSQYLPVTFSFAPTTGGIYVISFASISFDTTAPVVSGMITPAANGNGWNNTPVTVNWAATDPDSTATTPASTAVSTEGATQLISSNQSCDPAGNCAAGTIEVSIDLTDPTITGAVVDSTGSPRSPDGGGFYKSAVTVHWTCSDALSGVAICPANSYLTSDGSGLSATGAATDLAGNQSTVTVSGINIDSMRPTVSVQGVTTSTVYTLGSVPTVSCSSTDPAPGSGIAVPPALSVVGGNPDGSGTFTATCSGAVDVAGNVSASASVSYQVHYAVAGGGIGGGAAGGPVNAPPVVNTGKAGRTYSAQWQLQTAQGTPITSLSAIRSVTFKTTSCVSFTGDPTDALEATAAGNSGLSISGTIYRYNWKTPSIPGCYTLFVNTADGALLPAYFNLT